MQLQKQIADELGDRQDLMTPLSDSGVPLSPIQNAIQSAIAKWEREPFYFNEAYTVPLFTTVIGQELYTVNDAVTIENSPDIVKLHILISGNRFHLERRSWAYIEDISMNPNNRG